MYVHLARRLALNSPSTVGEYEKSTVSEITLERHGCFGSCPVYKIVLRADGTASYVGTANVARLGTYQGEIYFWRLAKWVETQGFFELQNEYATNWVDSEQATTSVVRDGERKTVWMGNTNEPPDALWGINAAIDGEASHIQWKKVE